MSAPVEKLLTEALEQNHMSCTAETVSKFLLFLNQLVRWNSVFNLTRLTTPAELVYGHIIDSLTCLPHLVGKNCLDVGSGAGLPGIPLAMIDPERSWTLLDKNIKKVRFLTQMIAELGLTNVVVQHGRVQDFHPSACFDSILSRAFTELANFLVWTEHLICPQGVFIAMKGLYPVQELADLPPNFQQVKSVPVQIQGWSVQRHILCFRKKEEAAWEK